MLSNTKSAIKRRLQRRNETQSEKLARLMRRDLGRLITQEIIDGENALFKRQLESITYEDIESFRKNAS